MKAKTGELRLTIEDVVRVTRHGENVEVSEATWA